MRKLFIAVGVIVSFLVVTSLQSLAEQNVINAMPIMNNRKIAILSSDR